MSKLNNSIGKSVSNSKSKEPQQWEMETCLALFSQFLKNQSEMCYTHAHTHWILDFSHSESIQVTCILFYFILIFYWGKIYKA